MAETSERVPFVGQLLDGRYKLVREIASGGMSTVYEALHVKIGRTVAIKVLQRDLAGDPEVVARFLNEARAVGTLGHPNIVASTDFGELPGHVPYLVLEYLQGHTLAEEVRTNGQLPIRRATRIALQIASALAAAHERDVIHRDLTAANIFLVRKEGNPDHVKVLDFGISKFLSVTDTAPRTRRGLTLGTPEYMAPEQISEPDSVDGRVDVYALGVIMYYVLRGSLPFTRAPLQSLLSQIVVDPPAPIDHPRIPDGLRAIVMKALAKNPADRFQTMREMGVELQRLSARLLSDTDFDRAIEALNWPSGATPRPLPLTVAEPLPGQMPERGPTARRISTVQISPQAPISSPAIPKTDPVIRSRGGRGVMYAALVLALVGVAGVGVLGWRSQRGAWPGYAPPPVAPVAVAPPPVAPPPAPAPKPVELRVSSLTPLARVTLRGRTHLLPFIQELRAGTEPEVVELTAPGREGKRFWITFDHPAALTAELREGRGVVEATLEETLIALGGVPVDDELAKSEPPAHGASSDKPAQTSSHHRHSSEKLVASSETKAEGTPAEKPPEPKLVASKPPEAKLEPSAALEEAKIAPSPPPAKVDAPKPAVAAKPPQPAAVAEKSLVVAAAAGGPPPAPARLAKVGDSKPAVAAKPPELAPAVEKSQATAAPGGPATAPARPGTTGLDPAKTQMMVKSRLPEIRHCYDIGKLEKPDIKGSVTVRISVSKSGSVTSAAIESSSLHSSVAEGCVVSKIRAWTFPTPVGGPTVISYPFNFR
jgi:serine/threonine-protein kinase